MTDGALEVLPLAFSPKGVASAVCEGRDKALDNEVTRIETSGIAAPTNELTEVVEGMPEVVDIVVGWVVLEANVRTEDALVGRETEAVDIGLVTSVVAIAMEVLLCLVSKEAETTSKLGEGIGLFRGNEEADGGGGTGTDEGRIGTGVESGGVEC